MGTITAKDIIDGAATILQDEPNTHWTREELLGWLNDGLRDMVIAKPDAYVENKTVQLVAGTKQSVPQESNAFMRMVRNMGAAGTTPGRVPRFIDREVLDLQNPNWHADTPSAEVRHYTHDVRDPLRFYVHPPQPTTGQSHVEIIYSATPPACAGEGDEISVADLYKSPLVNYLLYRAYAKDADYARNEERSQRYFNSFIQILLGKASGEGKNAPEARG